MARSLDAQTRRLFTHEAEWWGGGELLALHRKLLEHQPDAPALERPQ